MHRFLLTMIAFSLLLSIACGVQTPPLQQAVHQTQSLQSNATPVGQSGSWYLIFNDEFNDTSLTRRNWTTCYWWSEDGCTNADNDELQWYLGSQVLVEDGTLRLRADERIVTTEEGDVFEYVSGMITSGRHRYETSYSPRFSIQYGYIEMRARIPSGVGLWPAFWMLPVSHNSRPEIDIMEILGHDPTTIHMHLHYTNSDGNADRSVGEWSGPDFSEGWHVFAVHWEPNAVTWYVDGIERRRETDPVQIPSEPMYLLANLAVGGNWPGPPDESTVFPAFFDIDYIRVWKRENAILPGDTWRYFKGKSEPPQDWNTQDFDTSEWNAGPSGFGYGGGDDATLLSDMHGHYTSLYIRREFTIEDPDNLQQLMLAVDYSDGFVAYINGTEVARANMEGWPPRYDSRANSEHPASTGVPSVMTFNLIEARELLVPGSNVIAIQGHKVRLNSGNFSLIPTLISIEGES